MNPTTEHGAYAYLTVTCQSPLAEVEAWMGIAGGSGSWSVGDPRKNAKYGNYSFTMWCLGSGIDQGLPLDDHLRAIWPHLPPLRDALWKLPADWLARVACVARFASPNDAFAISAGHYRVAASYNLDLDCDFYFDDESAFDADGNLRFP